VTDEMTEVPPYLRYWSRPRPEPATVLADTGSAIAAALAAPDDAARIRDRMADHVLLSVLEGNYDCISILVRDELSPTLRREPSLEFDGRSAPHLAGRHHDALEPDAVAALQPLLETLCLQGFAASAAYDTVLEDGPALLRRRAPSEVLPRWTAHRSEGLHDVSPTFHVFLDAASWVTLHDLQSLATMLGLSRGRRPKEAAVALEVGMFLLGAGVDLYPYLTSRTDHLYA
jgi:hypothetical protein